MHFLSLVTPGIELRVLSLQPQRDWNNVLLFGALLTAQLIMGEGSESGRLRRLKGGRLRILWDPKAISDAGLAGVAADITA